MKIKGLPVLAIVVIVLLAVLAIKIISGAFSLVSGLFNTILGRAAVVALIAIVIWMFSYAKKHK